jgi:pimeloyl-ACP methyl ester carboxylesterase
MSVQPFKIEIPQAILDDLKTRLARTRWTDEVKGADWDYGTNLDYLKALVDYWQNDFDWRKQEAILNQFAHFQTEIDGLNIHFIHERGKGKNPIPIVLTHGWPDSFFRFYKMIPLLTEEKNGVSFDVIVPSLPGYGFSDKPKKPGVTAKISDLWHELMTEKLGYKKFAAGGGDMGSGVSQELGQSYGDSIIGLHLTDVPWQNYYFMSMNQDKLDLSKAEEKYFARSQQWMMKEGAYAMIQSTKPQTLAYGLNDSPVGLTAWIIEKFQSWSDSNGNVEKSFTKDELLTNIMIYWATETINSSFLYYYEPSNGHTPKNRKKKVEVPTGFALFPKDLDEPPRDFAERFFNVQHWGKMPRGGHFAALEEPELLAEDIRAFFRDLNKK